MATVLASHLVCVCLCVCVRFEGGEELSYRNICNLFLFYYRDFFFGGGGGGDSNLCLKASANTSSIQVKPSLQPMPSVIRISTNNLPSNTWRAHRLEHLHMHL